MAYFKCPTKSSGSGDIYGAEWAGTSDPAWVRTDGAEDFDDPNPYYTSMSGNPSSPFDEIAPWSGIKRVTDATAGELVEIPKYYYKWTCDNAKMKLQISVNEFDGSFVSPAHADRGDGKGERDVVYVGRYHCASNYKSTTGVSPLGSKTRAQFRSGIHNLGTSYWQYDFAMWWTINMLYLVEFANWNSQAKIGYGGLSSSANNPEVCGRTDSMPYHTGTTGSGRTVGGHIQYRYIEDLWCNIRTFCDGIYFSGSSNPKDVCCIKNPANFSDTAGGTKIGVRPSAGYIRAFEIPTASGFEYALFPSVVGGNDSSYVCDYLYANNVNGVTLIVGGYYRKDGYYGAFHLQTNEKATDSNSYTGSRLQKLP